MEMPVPSENDDTIHRVSKREPDESLPGSPSDSTPAPDGLDEAKTVIRQAAAPDQPQPNRGRQTPSEIAGVLVGQKLNQYFLEELIGGGGMGAVFRAHDTQLDRIVALKVIPFVGRDAELQRRFRNEAQNAAKLDHPQIARIFDAGSHDEWHYIIFEYIKGTNLRAHVTQSDVLTLDDAVFITAQVAQAIDHASQRGIVHRDIKPSNVLIADDGSVKLVDMGLARSDNLDMSEDMTASGVTLGTFDYISPEQALDPRDADIRSDIYSLGCTMYFMLTGQAPYTGGTMLQKLLSHGNAPLPDPREIRRQLPEEMVSVMHRMMAKDPKTRYQQANDLLADLNELAYRFQLKRSLANGVVAVGKSNEGVQRLQNHLPWVVAMTLVLVIGAYLELQAVASRNSFVVERPGKTINSGALADTRDSAGTILGNEREIQTNRPATLSVQPPETPPETDPDVAVPSSDAMLDASSSSGGLSPTELDSSELQTSTLSADRVSANAARPPSLIGSIPIPSELRNPASSVLSTDPVGEPVGRVMDNQDPSTTDANALISGESSGGSTTSAKSGLGKPEPPALPAPEAVRVVSPSTLAMAGKIDQVSRAADGTVLSATLSEAVDLAMRFGVLRVEFETPEIVSGPVAIETDEMVFVSTVGRTTIRLVSNGPMVIGRSDMIDLGNNRAQFINLDFDWELPDDQVDGGSMFVVNDNRFVRFQNCTFTLTNELMYDNVAFFRIVTDPSALPDNDTLPGRIFNPNENALPLVAIQLDNSIARGEADFIAMDYAAGLQLVWNNGLLAISGRMIDTSGARLRPPVTASPIQISLSNLTAKTSMGFLRMQLGPIGVYPVRIERESNQCVFVVDENRPHVEIAGVDLLNTQKTFVKLSGSKNAYQVSATLSDPMLLMSDTEGDPVEVNMSDLRSDSQIAASVYDWYSEQSTRWTVYWSKSRPLTKMEHRLIAEDFAQDGVVYGGLDDTLLPKLNSN